MNDSNHSNTLDVIRHHQQDYPDSLNEQEALVADIIAGKRGNTLILTEHPPIYTLGTSAKQSDVLQYSIDGENIRVFSTGRGGEVTYHGPGQLVCYVLRDIREQQDLHHHIWLLEEMMIRTLAQCKIEAERDKRGIGVWVEGLKIAAAGVRCRKWVTFHGIALNIYPKLKHFSGIVPCGMRDAPVTSMEKLGFQGSRQDVEERIIEQAGILFDG